MEEITDNQLSLEIEAQPNDETCGPTCLHAIYNFYDDQIELNQIIDEATMLREGGTLDVFLANHALRRGYRATIITYNLHVFDPTWFEGGRAKEGVAEKLAVQASAKDDRKLRLATKGYLDFLELGGRLRQEDLSAALVRRYLKKSVPILTGLSSTYLYKAMREFGPKMDDDDVRGEPTGHFVILSGYNSKTREVTVSDPLFPNPAYGRHQHYSVPIERVINAILLGIVTYDANILIIEPLTHR